ncbi:methionyl-tRNA formyltransferase [Comamonadaceae bacterium OS-1]|nr:methionyl-tRNA formyltransferase [Comamonadaceae bacterium OS-1]
MRVVFAGTPEFAQVALAALQAAGFEVVLVLTQPDRPAGRGMKLQASPVKQHALTHGIPVAQPRSLRLDGKYPDEAAAAQALLQAAQADVMVVVAYGLILPQWVLDVPRHGCLNIHASLLPRWRGAAPIHRAIEAGDAQTGVAIMQMDAGLDTGDMLLVESLPIAPTDTTGSLHDRLADLGGRMVVQALAQLGTLVPVPQPSEGITYAHKIEKREAAIAWTQSADTIVRRIRAFNPFPGAATLLAGENLKVWAATVSDAALPAGTKCGSIVAVTPESIAVAAMDSIVNITQVQRPGGKRLAVADFLRGCDVQPGMVFEGMPDVPQAR